MDVNRSDDIEMREIVFTDIGPGITHTCHIEASY